MEPRRRRHTLLAGAAALVVATALIGAVALAGDDTAGPRDSPAAGQPLPSASQNAQTGPTPSPSTSSRSSATPIASGALPSATAGTPGPRTRPPTPRPSASCAEDAPCPDGRPGWQEGADSCVVQTAAAVTGVREQEVVPGLVVSLAQASRAPEFPGPRVPLDLVLRNSGSTALTLEMDFTATRMGVVGGSFGFPDDVQTTSQVVGPGQTARLAIFDETMDTCADTSWDDDGGYVTLPRGRYDVVWTNPVTVTAEGQEPTGAEVDLVGAVTF